MAILRNESRNQYTVVKHSIIKDENLNLKEMGLLIRLLSLPDNWNFSEQGLCQIIKNDGISSIRSGLHKLEKIGYLARQQLRDEKGRITDMEWIIREDPQPYLENLIMDNPPLENPNLDNPNLENRIQLNINIPITNKTNDRLIDKKTLKNQIEYETLTKIYPFETETIDMIIDIATDTLTGAYTSTLDILNIDCPLFLERVKRLNMSVIEYILKSMQKNKADIKNIPAYFIKTIYNAPITYQYAVTQELKNEGII